MMNPRVLLILDIIRSGLYLFVGVFLLVKEHPWISDNTMRYAVAAIVLIYGLFRVYRTIKKMNENTAA
jgi:hypothetical protein